MSASSGVGVRVRDHGGELVAAEILEEVVGVDEVDEDDRGGAHQRCVGWAELASASRVVCARQSMAIVCGASACVPRKMCFVVVVFQRVVEFEGFARESIVRCVCLKCSGCGRVGRMCQRRCVGSLH